MKKLHIAVACAATFMAAGIASDAFAKGGPGLGFTNASGQHFSRAGVTPRPAGAAPVCAPVAGRTSNGEWFTGDPGNSVVTYNIGAGNQLLGVAADATITGNSPSWLSEASVGFSSTEVDDPDGIFLTVSIDDAPGVEVVTTEGVLLFSDFALPPVPVDADGLLRLEWFEGFDDSSVNPDTTWADSPTPFTCSGIRLVCTNQAACDTAVSGVVPVPPVPYSFTPVPTLGQWSLGLLAGALGFLAFRNRRQFGSRS